MFDIHRWADWASQQALTLRTQGFDTHFKFMEESQATLNPSFFVDLDHDNTLGRIIFWSSGDFDISIHRSLSNEPAPISGLPAEATDDNFKAIFGRFVEEVSA